LCVQAVRDLEAFAGSCVAWCHYDEDAVATANVMRVGVEIESANNRLNQAMQNVEQMIVAESRSSGESA